MDGSPRPASIDGELTRRRRRRRRRRAAEIGRAVIKGVAITRYRRDSRSTYLTESTLISLPLLGYLGGQNTHFPLCAE